MPTERPVTLDLERRVRRVAVEEIAKLIRQRIVPLEHRIGDA